MRSSFPNQYNSTVIDRLNLKNVQRQVTPSDTRTVSIAVRNYRAYLLLPKEMSFQCLDFSSSPRGNRWTKTAARRFYAVGRHAISFGFNNSGVDVYFIRKMLTGRRYYTFHTLMTDARKLFSPSCALQRQTIRRAWYGYCVRMYQRSRKK